ncbi:MAG: hypothetical protein M1817_006370 [Caeruleum heppii]|nr:MAG: hypothetical protein M1817_006370 [Caeruleum heppii]
MIHRGRSKAAQYSHQLEHVRCHGQWEQIPEVLKKVKKYTPHRRALLLTAQCEYDVYRYLRTRPGTSTSTTSSPLKALIDPLSDIITATESRLQAPLQEPDFTEAKLPLEDVFQAKVCLAWVHWLLGDYHLTVARLPGNIVQDWQNIAATLGPYGNASGWTKVCAVKVIYLKGISIERTAGPNEALEILATGLDLTEDAHQAAEARLWAERLHTRCCLLSARRSSTSLQMRHHVEVLQYHRAWARLVKPNSGTGGAGGPGTESQVPRRQLWFSYYATLSAFLQHDMSYVPDPHQSPSGDPSDQASSTTSARQALKQELYYVQTIYERLLLQEVPFPKATEHNFEIEEWVEHVIGNWKVMSGDKWAEEDVGTGGKVTITREVAEILYRAATRTFHSTAVLRHLFIIHLYLADFDLAFRAFETYLEIVTKGRARVQKSGIMEPSLDDDDIALATSSHGIEALCRFGGRREGARAVEIAHLLSDWLGPHLSDEEKDGGRVNGSLRAKQVGMSSNVSSQSIASVYRAVAISRAHWARINYDASSRADLRTQAIGDLRRSLSPAFECTGNLDSLFALGLLLAETRDVTGAIDVVKRALLPESGAPTESRYPRIPSGPPAYVRERKTLPLWHLLALLLSAREDFVMSIKTCEAAFEQFGAAMLGDVGASDNSFNANGRGVLSRMNESEKGTLVQIKMTELALVEIVEGPDTAVNASEDLLTIYSRLFDHPQLKDIKTEAERPSSPPKSSSGTLRSLRGTILGRSRSKRRSQRESEATTRSSVTVANLSSRRASSQPPTPVIQVTDETADGAQDARHHHHLHHHGHQDKARAEKLHKRTANGSVRTRKSLGSLRRKKRTAIDELPPGENHLIGQGTSMNGTAHEDTELVHRPRPEGLHPARSRSESPSPSQVGLAVSPDVPAPAPMHEAAHQPYQQYQGSTQRIGHPTNLPREKAPLPHGHEGQVPEQDVRLPSLPHPLPDTHQYISIPHLPSEHQRRQRVILLVRVWLLIAGLYRRANLLEDARGAIQESYELVRDLEAEYAKDLDYDKHLDGPLFGGGVRVEEAWGDVWSERASLALAHSAPHDAVAYYERALDRCPDHAAGTVGLCNILLDIYEERISPRAPDKQRQESTSGSSTSTDPLHGAFSGSTATPSDLEPSPLHALGLPHPPKTLSSSSASSVPMSHDPTVSHWTTFPTTSSHGPLQSSPPPTHPPPTTRDLPPETLHRLAARDRAAMLLSSLTKSGHGWDQSEAWFALARAHELSGDVEGARKVLWWVLSLEEARGVRGWEVVRGMGRGIL